MGLRRILMMPRHGSLIVLVFPVFSFSVWSTCSIFSFLKYFFLLYISPLCIYCYVYMNICIIMIYPFSLSSMKQGDTASTFCTVFSQKGKPRICATARQISFSSIWWVAKFNLVLLTTPQQIYTNT